MRINTLCTKLSNEKNEKKICSYIEKKRIHEKFNISTISHKILESKLVRM